MRFDAEQRFTCQQCARCCTRPWSIVVTQAEREDLRRAQAERFFRESAEQPEGAEREAFEPLAGGLFAIRKRADGACGFLSPANRCRLHEELGARKKPLACQVFPFRFQGGPEAQVVTVSSACPSVARGLGETLGQQAKELRALGREWARTFAEPEGQVAFVAGHPLGPAVLASLVDVLVALLERPGPAGPPDLRTNVGRMAALLFDLTRLRVLRLGPERFAEYLALVGRHAASPAARDVPPRTASLVARLQLRGLLFAALQGRVQAAHGPGGGLRLGLRAALAQLLLHLHGLWPAPRAFDLGRAAAARVDLGAPACRELARGYLRRSLRALGAGRRPVLDELCLAVALLNVALVLGAARAQSDGRAVADERDLVAALNEAADLAHADESSLYARLLLLLGGNLGALDVFASGRDGISR